MQTSQADLIEDWNARRHESVERRKSYCAATKATTPTKQNTDAAKSDKSAQVQGRARILARIVPLHPVDGVCIQSGLHAHTQKKLAPSLPRSQAP